MHRDMRADLQAFPSSSRIAEQRACDRWRLEFNQVRPHEALKGKTPSELYKRSERRPQKTKYMYPPEWVVRTVTDNGVLHFAGVQIQAGRALVRERVALEPLGGSSHRLWFRELDLGKVDLPIPNLVIDTVMLAHLERSSKEKNRRLKKAV